MCKACNTSSGLSALHRPANYAAGVEVKHCGQIGQAFPCANVGDVRHPGFVRYADIDLPSQRVIGGSRWLATAPLIANLCLDSGHFHLSWHAVCEAMSRVRRNGNHINPAEGSFAACPADNIDYAVMKKLRR